MIAKFGKKRGKIDGYIAKKLRGSGLDLGPPQATKLRTRGLPRLESNP
jgi:hypothetical protein